MRGIGLYVSCFDSLTGSSEIDAFLSQAGGGEIQSKGLIE
jgi:hypothetical protein